MASDLDYVQYVIDQIKTRGTITYRKMFGEYLISLGLIPRPSGAENWGCGGFVPPHTQRFQGKIFNTPLLAAGILYLL
jgi:hypothetical protein